MLSLQPSGATHCPTILCRWDVLTSGDFIFALSFCITLRSNFACSCVEMSRLLVVHRGQCDSVLLWTPPFFSVDSLHVAVLPFFFSKSAVTHWNCTLDEHLYFLLLLLQIERLLTLAYWRRGMKRRNWCLLQQIWQKHRKTIEMFV